MSGTSTPSRRLSSTTMRVAPPSRRKARSCNSAQMRELERNVSRRTDAAAAQRHHEQPGAPILAALGIAHHGAGAIIDLRLLASGGDDHHASFGRLRSAPLAHETLHALVA